MAGSEDGIPRIWDTALEQQIKGDEYEWELNDLLADVQWNNKYNMFALAGFGQNFPICVYVYQRGKEEMDRAMLMGIEDNKSF